PSGGTPLTDLIQRIDTAAGKGFDPANPGFVGYIPGGGLYSAALADFIACSINRYTGVSAPAPVLVQMEASVLRWLCDRFGFPPASQGVLTSGGSMSNLSAIVTARASQLGEAFLEGTMYVSDEVHHSISKSARIAGLPQDAVRMVPCHASLRMDLEALQEMIINDRERGRKPFLVVGSAGTVATGVIDPLQDLADLAAREGIWFHVDGAYGGFFQLSERGRDRLAGIDRADSITLDPHKGLFLPYGTGCLLARDGEKLRYAHEVHADYLPRPSDDPGLPDFSSFSPELTRDFRGLRLWVPLHLHGVDAFVAALDEKLDLARYVYDELSALPSLSVPWSPELSLVAFRPRAGGDAEADALLDRINSDGRMWLSSAVVGGRTYLRICILSHRTHPQRIKEGIEIIRAAVA
ncbi:MAG: aminotransferase class I/II-fold pyridoxal phosphate-dependent enzyme, partial [Actinobacteria bacterium]|nr:aminotransferase class I/II-fold pyridoxal phosphate-dependent enzyme [Actinomycetota bacterium]